MSEMLKQFEELLSTLDLSSLDTFSKIESFIKGLDSEEEKQACSDLFIKAFLDQRMEEARQNELKKRETPYNYEDFYDFQYIFLPFAYYAGIMYRDEFQNSDNLLYALYDLHTNNAKFIDMDKLLSKEYFKHSVINYNDVVYDVFSFDNEIFQIEPLSKAIIMPRERLNATISPEVFPYFFFTLEYGSDPRTLHVCGIYPKSQDLTEVPYDRMNFGQVSSFDEGMSRISEIISSAIQRSLYGEETFEA